MPYAQQAWCLGWAPLTGLPLSATTARAMTLAMSAACGAPTRRFIPPPIPPSSSLPSPSPLPLGRALEQVVVAAEVDPDAAADHRAPAPAGIVRVQCVQVRTLRGGAWRVWRCGAGCRRLPRRRSMMDDDGQPCACAVPHSTPCPTLPHPTCTLPSGLPALRHAPAARDLQVGWVGSAPGRVCGGGGQGA